MERVCQFGWLLGVILLFASGARTAELAFAITAKDLDPAQCMAFAGGHALTPPPANVLEGLLGLAPLPDKGAWNTGDQLDKMLHFRIAFTQPIALGTIITTFTDGKTPGFPVTRPGGYVSYLKPEAAYPGDPAQEEQWVMLPPGAIKILPPGVKIRALRFTQIGGEWGYGGGGDRFQANLGPTLLFAERYYSALNLGHGKIIGKTDGPKYWVGSWVQPQTIVGLVARNQPVAAEVKYLKPTVTLPSVLATPADWKKATDLPSSRQFALDRFETPLTTKALQISSVGGDAGIYPLVNLGAAPFPPSTQTPPPPYHVKYTMPMTGIAAVDILDKDGKLVRQLVAEVARDKGPVEESWDLKDGNGAPVPPGDYSFRAIARPPLKLTYQTTVYNAGQPAWWAPAPGKGGGGWLADHTPPNCAAACGDYIILAAPCNESGHGIIAVDHDGNKVWGEPYLTGFDIARRIACDTRYAYVNNVTQVQRIDTKDGFKTTDLIMFKYNRALPQGVWDDTHGGLAVFNNKLYVGHDGPTVPWLQSSFLSDLLDPEHSYPRIWLRKGNGVRQGDQDKIYGQESYDELQQFYGAFMTKLTPAQTSTMPSMFLPNSIQAFFGDAPNDGPFANLLIAAFKKPVTVSSIILPEKVPVYVLKPGVQLPSDDASTTLDPEGNAEDNGNASIIKEEDWLPLTVTGKAGMPCIALAPDGGIKTLAIRFKATRLSFALVTSRRFDDAAPEAERIYSEGAATKTGAWMLNRQKNQAVNQYNAPTLALIWPQPVPLHGLGIVRPGTGAMAVDIWTGPAGADPKTALQDEKMWREVNRFSPEIYDGWFAQRPGMQPVDFGETLTVRAVRIRALAPTTNREPTVGADWPAEDAVLTGVVACRPLGGDPTDLDADMSQRIVEYQLPEDGKSEAKELRTFPFKDPGPMIFDKAGVLYAASNHQIVTVPLEGKGEPKIIVKGDLLEAPSSLAFDADGLLYVADMGPQVVKVFDPKTGKLLRTIGKPGGNLLGPWDPEYMEHPTGITIDSAGKLWIAHNAWAPKRISRWSRDGKHEVSFFGPTQYGGGGWMDEGNHSLIYYAGMKFVIDWKTYDWKLASIVFKSGPGRSIQGPAPDRVVYYKGHRYLVGNSAGNSTLALIAEERNEIAVPLAMSGCLRDWGEIGLHPDLLRAFGALDRGKYCFVWSDKNGDGIPQADEVQISDQKNFSGGIMVGEDLAFNANGARLRPTGLLPNGTPTYDVKQLEMLPLLTSRAWSASDGRTFTMVDQWDRLLPADGKSITWKYFDEFGLFAGWYTSNWGYDRPAGKLNAEQSIFGHLKDVGPNKEEFWITSSDQGDWFALTGDGMLAGCIFGGPTGFGLRRWTMPEWTPNKTDLSDLRLQQECYQGCVVRAEDGKVYAVAGKNHASVVLVEGLEQLQRLKSPVSVTAKDITDNQQWEIQKAATEKLQEEPKIAKAPYLNEPIQVNGALDEWPGDLFFTIHQYVEHGLNLYREVTHSQGAFAYDAENLYIAVKALDDSPMKNSGVDPKSIFKTGDAVDLQLGLDPNADPKRTGPAPGDVRVLITQVKDKPLVMLYRYKDPTAAPDKRVRFTSPVDETIIDSVSPLDDVEVTFTVDNTFHAVGYVMEAAIPWKALGVPTPKVGSKIRADIGILQSDQNGVQTVNRLYWSGKSQRVVADQPMEARVSPILWGELYFTEQAESTKTGGGDDIVAP